MSEADLWRAIHAALAAGAMVSKLVTDRPSTRIDRGPLRAALNLDDASPFLERSAVRNHFEHLDEKFEKWARSGSRSFLDRNVGPPDAIVVQGEQPGKRFHQYDPATTTVSILGESVELASLALAARELLPEAERVAGQRRPRT